MSDAEAAARSEVAAALVALRLDAASMDLVSPLGTRKGARSATSERPGGCSRLRACRP